MNVTLAAPPGESEPTPTGADFTQIVLEKLRVLEATAVRLAAERDAALARARAAELDAAGLLRANLELQKLLTEYGQDRRGYEAIIADLRAANAQLAGQVVAADDVPRRGRWRR